MQRVLVKYFLGLVSALCTAGSIGLASDFHFLNNRPLEGIEFYEPEESTNLLVTIISEPENNLEHTLHVVSDHTDGTMLKLIRRSTESTQEVLAEDLLSRFVVMATASGRDAILLGCPNCTVDQGGTAVFKYLYNGITMSYRSFDMQFVKVNQKWVLLKTDGTLIHTLRLKSRTVLGQVIGISEVLINS